jgi:hypothetical protein
VYDGDQYGFSAMRNWVLFIFFISLSNVLAQEIAVPVGIQLPLFLKLLSFDRDLNARSEKELVIGVVYQKFRTSLETKDEFQHVVDELAIKTLNGVPFRSIPLEIVTEMDLENAISETKIHILYITPLRALSIEKIAEICRRQKVLALTGVPEYVDWGIGIGIGSKGQKPQVIINLASVKAGGANFSSTLLQLKFVKIIH